jgi:hypothetical protein
MKFCPKVNLDTLVQEKQAGLYAWTGDNWEGTPPSTKYKIKIGMSTSVCNRLYNYHTGHPDGVWILDLLLLKPGVSPKEIRGLETQLKQELKQFFYQAPSRALNRGEWFISTELQMFKAFKAVFDKNKSLCSNLIRPPTNDNPRNDNAKKGVIPISKKFKNLNDF